MADTYTLADFMRALQARRGHGQAATPAPSLSRYAQIPWEPYQAPMSDMTTKGDLIRQMRESGQAHEPAIIDMMSNYRPGSRQSDNAEVRPYGQSMPTYAPWPQSRWDRFSPSSSSSPSFPDIDFWWRQRP